jgi:hypothetical protein
MQARPLIRLTSISVACLLLAGGLAREASAGPIKLDNDVDVKWSDTPCLSSLPPTLCSDPVVVVGAPRFVRDARDFGDLLTVTVKFLSVAIEPIPTDATGQPLDDQGNNTLFLNVGDSALNEILRPGTDLPLQLMHPFNPTGSSVPAMDVVLKLRDFEGFDLLPAGDLIFTVEFGPRLSFSSIETGPERPARAAIINLSGPGTVVPEPGTLALSLCALTSLALRIRRRRLN